MIGTDGTAGVIGRIEQRAALARWLDEAIDGEPRVVLVSGDPGMGKTTLMRWLLDRARADGAVATWAAALEGIDVPFLAGGRLLAGLPSSLGFPGERADQPDDHDMGSLSGGHQSPVTKAVDRLLSAAAVTPLVVMIDDLQWADEATAALIQHLTVTMATDVTPPRLLLVAGIRSPSGGDALGAGARTVSRLNREPVVRQVHVPPMNEVDVREFCRATDGRSPGGHELRALLRDTGGSPLLLKTLLQQQDGLRPPAGDTVIDLLGPRYAHLPSVSRRALELLAAVGSAVPTVALPALLGPRWETALQPAIDSGLIVSEWAEVAFEHSLHRTALLRMIPTERSDRLRTEVAAIVTSPELRDVLPAAVVAAHLRTAPNAAPPDVHARVNWAAGEDAWATGAWGQAADLFASALRALDGAGPETTWPDAGARWLRAGEAAFRDHDPRCHELFRRAVETAAVDDDIDVQAPAQTLLLRALITLGRGEHDVSEVEEATLALAERDDSRLLRWRASLYGTVVESRFGSFDVVRGRHLAELARRAGEAAGDTESMFSVSFAEGVQHMAALQVTRAAECFERAASLASTGGLDWLTAPSAVRRALVSFLRGDLVNTDRLVVDGLDAARRHHHWSESSLGGAVRTALLAVRALPGVEAEAEAAAAMLRRSEYGFTAPSLYPALAYSRATRGDIDGAREALDELEHLGHRAGPHRRALALLEHLLTGRLDLEDTPPRRPRTGDPVAFHVLASIGADAELAIARHDERSMEEYSEVLDRVLASGAQVAPGWPHFFPRIRAELAIALDAGDRHEHLARASAATAAQGLTFETVRIELIRSSIAPTLAEAATHAATALRVSDTAGLLCGTAASLRRLRALGASPDAPLARAVLNTDIVSSTSMTTALGDEAWLELLGEHDDVLHSTIRRHGGVVFKHTGDGAFAWFVSPIDAVAAARRVLGEFDGRLFRHGMSSVHLRIGVSMGSPLERDGDLFGATVIEASRLCALAAPSRGLVTSRVASALDHELPSRGSMLLKGFETPVEVFEIGPAR